MADRKICVVTGTRAEYGLLYWLMKEIAADPTLALQLVVTGAHLSEKFGKTAHVIEDDGFAIDARVDIAPDDDSAVGIARSMGLAVTGMAEAFQRLAPDIVVVLGDRYEILAAAEAAMIARIPIAHIHGGEATEGLIDEAIRHSVTKMAHLHFVSTEDYRRRVVQLGEDPERVFNVGATGIDNIVRLDLPSRADLQRDLGLDLSRGYFLVTYHPVTLSDRDPATVVAELLAAFDRFPGHRLVVTGVNADPGHDGVARTLTDYAADHSDRVSLHMSLGQRRYLGAMKHAAAVVGNSSSGIVEAPALKVPTVDVGDRQRGRVRASSVIHCEETADAIAAAIAKALSPAFAAVVGETMSPHGNGGASGRIKEILKNASLKNVLMKSFYDLRVPA